MTRMTDVPELDEKLKQRLRSLDTRADARELAEMRQELLRRAAAESPSWRARIMFAFAALTAFAVGGVVFFRTEPALEPVAPEAPIVATPEGEARWSTTPSPDVEHIDLSDGTLRLRIKQQAGSRRVVVRVPDGEIEDLGTIFHVSVTQGRTQRVGVDEGLVTIRLRGMAPFTISAGQTWERSAEAPPASVENRVDLRVEPTSRKRTSDAPTPAPTLVVPADAAQEDAAYLQILDALDSGDVAAARALADAYLVRFPNGFRREEVNRVGR